MATCNHSHVSRRVLYFLCALSVFFLWAALLQRSDFYHQEKSLRDVLRLSTSRVNSSSPQAAELVGEKAESNEMRTKSPNETVAEFVEEKTKSNVNQGAFWMAVSYSGQMTSCVADLLTLQCFASVLDKDLHVVEPFIDTESGLGTHSFHLESSQDSLTLYDVFDKEEWNKLTKSHSQLVSWKYFIQNAPRKVIIVDPECNGLFPLDCHKKQLQQLTALFENQYRFEIVNTVYFRNAKPHSFPVQEYKRLLYGRYSPQEVVVLFHVWGEEDYNRIDFRQEKIKCRHEYRHMPVSNRIKHDASVYAQKYMSTDTHSYISVMVRLEWFHRTHLANKGMSNEQILSTLLSYYKTIFKKVEYLKELKNVSSVFFTTDCTEQGSKYFKDQHDKEKQLVASSADTLFQMFYGNSSNSTEWEANFYETVSSRNKGYIAHVQKYLAAKGICLVTAGGGTFHKTTAELHRQLHPNSACVHAVDYQQ